MTSRPTRKRLWRKRLTRAILCLFLGAVTTVGVAWGAATVPNIQGVVDSRDDPLWPGLVSEEWPARPSAVSSLHAPGLDWLYGEGTRGGDRYEQTVVVSGWPFRSLSGWTQAVVSISGRPGQFKTAASVTRVYLLDYGRAGLPLRPVLPGFLLDTLFYAARWWLVLITPGAIRRFRRRRRGRCTHCGYDLAGLAADDKATPTCPECGA